MALFVFGPGFDLRLSNSGFGGHCKRFRSSWELGKRRENGHKKVYDKCCQVEQS